MSRPLTDIQIRAKRQDIVENLLPELRKFASEVLIPMENGDPESDLFPTAVARQMYDLGLFNLVIPAALRRDAGAKEELSLADLIWVMREIASGSSSMAGMLIGNWLGLSPLLLYGSDELKLRVANSFINNFSLFSFAMTEVDVGSNLAATQTTATETSSGYEISGVKTFITNASHAEHICVFARLIDERGNDQGISCFYVSGFSPGLSRGIPLKKTGWRKMDAGVLHFDKVQIPRDQLIGTPGRGLRILAHCLNRSRTLLAAMGVGIQHRAIDLVQERLAGVQRYGKPLNELEAIRHELAKLYTLQEASWMLTCKAASVWDTGESSALDASVAKLYVGTATLEITAKVVELFGSKGLMRDAEVARLYQDSKFVEIVEGPSLVQEVLIARQIVARPPAVAPKAPLLVLAHNSGSQIDQAPPLMKRLPDNLNQILEHDLSLRIFKTPVQSSEQEAFEEVYAFWKRIWSETNIEIGRTETLVSDQLTRQQEILALYSKDRLIAIVCQRYVPLHAQSTKEDSFFRDLYHTRPQDMSKLDAYKGTLHIGTQITIDPTFRKSSSGLGTKLLISFLSIERARQVGVDVILGMMRIDRGMHTLYYQVGAVPISENIPFNKSSADLIAFFPKEKPFRLPGEYELVTKRLLLPFSNKRPFEKVA